MAEHFVQAAQRGQGLVDVLDRILDKGLVIAGDIKINLANVELLTIRIRLLVCSIDKAEQIGINWWITDPGLTPALTAASTAASDGQDVALLTAKIDALAGRLEQLEQTKDKPSSSSKR